MTEDYESLSDLLGFEERFGEPLRARLAQLASSWAVPGEGMRSSAVGQVVDRIQGVFSTPLYKVLAAAWRKHPSCRAFCDPAKYPPGDINTVQLAEHSLGWECEPAVEVLADGLAASGMARLAELKFEIEVDGAVQAGVVTIRDGRFIKMESANLVIGASLRVEGFTVARHQVPLHIPGTLKFGEDGEPICPAPEGDDELPAASSAAVPPAQIAVPAIVDAEAVQGSGAAG